MEQCLNTCFEGKKNEITYQPMFKKGEWDEIPQEDSSSFSDEAAA